jgi:hypothetical protein
MGKQNYNTKQSLIEQIISALNLNIANRDLADYTFIQPSTSFINVTAVDGSNCVLRLS